MSRHAHGIAVLGAKPRDEGSTEELPRWIRWAVWGVAGALVLAATNDWIASYEYRPARG